MYDVEQVQLSWDFHGPVPLKLYNLFVAWLSIKYLKRLIGFLSNGLVLQISEHEALKIPVQVWLWVC